MIDLENLLIYKEYVEMIYFTIDKLMDYPEENEVSVDVKKLTYNGLNCLIRAHKEEELNKKLLLLEELDASLKTLKILVNISKKKQYINIKTQKAWNKKIINISNLTWTWIKSCENKGKVLV